MPGTTETTETQATDLFAELIRQTFRDIEKEKAERGAQAASVDTLTKQTNELRKRAVRQMLQEANDCLRKTQGQSPAFTTWLSTTRPLQPAFAFCKEDSDPSIKVLKLFEFEGVMSSKKHAKGWVCLVR